MYHILIYDVNSYIHLCTWNGVLLKTLIILQLSTKLPAFYEIRRFIAAFTNARHLSLSSVRSILSMPHPTSWRSILILSSHLSLFIPSGFFPSGFDNKILCASRKFLYYLSNLQKLLKIKPSHSMQKQKKNLWNHFTNWLSQFCINIKLRIRKLNLAQLCI